MIKYIVTFVALFSCVAAAQTIKTLGYNATNGVVVYSGTNSLTFTNALQFSTNARAATRTNLGLGATWLTNTDSANFRSAIGLGSWAELNDGASIRVEGLTISDGEQPNYTQFSTGGVSFNGGNDVQFRGALGLGATWLTNTNVTNFRTAIGLGVSNTVVFSNVQLNILNSGSSSGFIGRNGTQLSLYGTNVTTAQPAFYGYTGFANTAFSADTARTNLGLGATWLTNANLTNFRTAIGLGVTDSVTFSNTVVAGSLSVNSLSSVTTTSSGPTTFVLALPANTNVLRITGVAYNIERVSGGRLGAFYYLINETGSDLLIKHTNGISIHGGADLTLGPNQAATLITTGATNASVASRGGLGPNNNVTFSNITASGTLTSTGNVTMSGTANTAPNQTALSGSSLITRDLMYSAQTDDSSGDLIGGAGSAGTSGFGSGAGNYNGFGVFAQVGFVTNSYGGAYFLDDLWTHANYSGGVMPANKVIDVAFKGVMFRVETNQNWVLRVVAGVGAPNRVVPKLGENALSGLGWGVNFFYDGTNHVYQPFWYTTNYNVGPQTVISNLSASSWLGRVYSMRLRQETNGAIKFWINNGFGERLSSTPSWQTNVVWGANSFAGRFMGIECATAPNAAPVTGSRIHFRAAYVKYEP
jgi:hypothetical protein